MTPPHAQGNAWSADMWEQWGEAVAELEARNTLRVVRGGGQGSGLVGFGG